MRSRQCLYAICAFLLVLAPRLGAQQVTGRVTNAQTGEPLAAVQVFIAGSGIGALTQQNGRYLLLNVPAGTHTLTAERIGYRSATRQVTVTASATTVQDFGLGEEALGLDEIIVTGTPGGTQRRAIGNTVASVRAGEVRERAVVTNAQGLLRGRSPGLTMGVPSGSIGQGADITIRGVGSFNRDRSNPLIFVDGIRVNNSNDAGPQMGQGQRLGNVLDDFNPADIESIEIIKGPAAATLYGTEASAGVIQIITKRGQQGEPQFTASVAGGLNFTRVPHERMGTNWACTDTRQTPCVAGLSAVVPYDMVHLMNRALRDGTLNPEWNYENWPQKNLFQYGPSHSLNVDVRGGTDRIRYFLSANHDRDEGPEFYNWNDALRMRANVGVILSDEFSLDISTGYVSGETSYSSQAGLRGGTWDQMVWGSGYCAPYVAKVNNPCPRVLGFQQMIPTDIAKVTSIREYDRFTGSGTLSYTRGWLASRLIMGIDNGYDTNTWTHPIETVQAAVIQETQFGEVVLERPSNKDVSLDWSATVTLPLPSNVSTATSVGAQYFSRTHQFFGNTGRGFASPLSRTINQTPVTSMSVNYDYIENKSLGFYVQEQLGWNDRLFLTTAVRFDDNSAFGSAFDPVMYPKVSAAWVISEESFWNVGFVDELRLRGAWGQAGRQPDTFAGVNTFGVVAGPGGRSVLNPASTGNPDVGPEKSSELEVGFDVETLEGRMSGEFTWYKKVSEDNLLGIALPGSMGAGGARQENVGVIENWGWEALLNTRIYEGSNIAFAVDFGGAYKMNEITELGDYPGSGDIRLGLPYPSQTASTHWIVRAEYNPAGPIVDGYGRRIQAYCDAGVLLDPAGGDPRESQYGTVLGGEIVPCQQVAGYASIVGPAFSPYTWTVNPKVTLHGALQLHAMIDGAFGGYGQDSQKQWHHTYNTAYGAVTHADPHYAAMHRLGANSGRALFKKEFWKLREAGVRYQMPEVFTGRFGAERAAVSLSAREIATLWSTDPHAGLQPSARMLNFPPATLRDIEPGRAGEGDGGHRSYPPSTSLHLRLDVTF